jgi:aspartate aminotransferase
MISKRISSISESASVKLAGEISTLRSQGEKIIGLHIGEPDFLPEPQVAAAITKALNEGKVRYSQVAGEIPLRKKIVESELKNSPINLNIENIVVSNGSKQSLYNIFQTICDPDDEIIILAPYWISFPESVKLAGAVPKIIFLDKDLQPDLELIKRSITKKTKGLIINNPSNPTGVIFKKNLLREIGELALKHDFYIISDEAYDGLIYNKNEYSSFFHIDPRFFSHVITAKTFSKTYAMTGHRIGYTIASKHISAALTKLQGHLTGNNCTFVQYGAIGALDISQDHLNQQCDEFKQRRDFCYAKISSILPCVKPDGAFYLFPNVESFLRQGESAKELCEDILKQTKVAVLPGDAFGRPGFIRIAFTVAINELEQAMDLLINFFNKRK